MTLSVFDLFKVGIGPSSSHTVGPMRAAGQFARDLAASGELDDVRAIRVDLLGSLGATGVGHGTVQAVMWGLAGLDPSTMRGHEGELVARRVRGEGRLRLIGTHDILFRESDVRLEPAVRMEFHPNACSFTASGADGGQLSSRTYFSVGGGFVVTEEEAASGRRIPARPPAPHPYRTGEQLLALTASRGTTISDLALANETARLDEPAVRAGLLEIWGVMQESVRSGCAAEGVLPGGLEVRRRAPALFRTLMSRRPSRRHLEEMDWVNLYALAVNEENASGSRIVTAPTNGAAGVVPAVLHYHQRFIRESDDDVCRFLLTAGAIGSIIAEGASISGAEVGCQGEVGAASAMAAAGLAEVLGGSSHQVENAAEIALEHHLGMTCDPVGGLVQIPCIERNAMGAVKAINAARMALAGDGRHMVSLDQVVTTMRETGRDMQDKYKETGLGGLAVNVVEC